jgi:15-cis-phytoene synthase
MATGPAGDLVAQCLEIVRAYDPDRYTATLYLGQNPRKVAAAVHAFDAEIARIADRVSEPIPGEIRLQWWREVVEGSRETGNHPVVLALIDAIRTHDLPREPLLAAIEARVFDLYHDAMPDRTALEAYCGETGSVLLQVIALAARAKPGSGLADACGHAGVALRLTEILRRAPLDRSRGKCPFPVDMLSSVGLSVDEWLREAPQTRHGAAISAIVSLAREHLALARPAISDLEPQAKPVFLPLAVLPAWLDAIEAAAERQLLSPASVSPLRRQWIFLRAALAG